MQRQDSSQATSTLSNTPNLPIGSYTKGNTYIGSSDRENYTSKYILDYGATFMTFARALHIFSHNTTVAADFLFRASPIATGGFGGLRGRP